MALLGGDPGQRRRRVLTEQMLSSSTADRPAPSDEGDAAGGGVRAARFSEQALSAQPSLTSFVATRYATLALWLMLASLVVVGLESAYVHLPELRKIAGDEAVAAFDLAARGNLGDWYGSLLMTLAAVGSLAIYSIRRHKIDDYSGRYRIWLWAAFGWLLLSAATTAPFYQLIPPLAVKMSGFLGWAGGAWWWLAPALMFYGALGMRLALDVRECKLALTTLLLAFAGWALALLVRLGGLSLDAELATVVRTSAVMAGQVLLLTALGLYARFNLLDARGLLPVRPARSPGAKKSSWRERRAAAQAAKAVKAEEKAAARAAAAEAKAAAKTAAADAKTAAAEAKRAAKAEASAKNLKVDAAHASPPPPVSRPARNNEEDEDRSDQYASDDYESDDSDEDWDEDGNPSSRKLTKAERRRLRKQGRQGRA